MAHFSEMDFLFSNQSNSKSVTQQLDQTSLDNNFNIFKGSPSYVVYKQKFTISDSNSIKNYLKSTIYKEENTKNPYIKLLDDFGVDKRPKNTPGAALRLKAADLAYLRDLGVYPLNRMAILRRFNEGILVPENLEELTAEPISTIVGWIKPDQNFGTINFNETWEKTQKRFDILLSELVQKNFGINITAAVPLPDFAQGILFQFYNKMGLVGGATDKSTNEQIQSYDGSSIKTGDDNWGLLNIPVGDPNVLQEGPFRNPLGQNIKSDFNFELTTTYEQKLIGNVDPGSAMLDIIDNIYAMGTSNMVFYWNEDSGIVQKAREASLGKGNDLGAWWRFLVELFDKFWESLKDLFNDVKVAVEKYNINEYTSPNFAKVIKEASADVGSVITTLMKSILTSTIAIHRFEIRGSIELMTGGKYSSTPWYLTIGNPYSPWLATNHIIVNSCSIETSTEMGFNDQPQMLTAKFNCSFSRSLGKQELMRMFNNTFRRTYISTPKIDTKKAQVYQNNELIKDNGLISTKDIKKTNLEFNKLIRKNSEE